MLEPLLSRRGDGGHCGLWRVALALGVVANGAFLFGYYLAAINGPLPQIAADLKVDNNPQLQGLVSAGPGSSPLPLRARGALLTATSATPSLPTPLRCKASAAQACSPNPNPTGKRQIVSSLLAGGAVGSILGSGLADKFGRRQVASPP